MTYAVLLPERFRGCCTFGATNLNPEGDGLSRAAVSTAPRLLDRHTQLRFSTELTELERIECAPISHAGRGGWAISAQSKTCRRAWRSTDFASPATLRQLVVGGQRLGSFSTLGRQGGQSALDVAPYAA